MDHGHVPPVFTLSDSQFLSSAQCELHGHALPLRLGVVSTPSGRRHLFISVPIAVMEVTNMNAKCPNTCWESGKVARDQLKKKEKRLSHIKKVSYCKSKKLNKPN